MPEHANERAVANSRLTGAVREVLAKAREGARLEQVAAELRARVEEETLRMWLIVWLLFMEDINLQWDASEAEAMGAGLLWARANAARLANEFKLNAAADLANSRNADVVFGDARAEAIGITETTRTITAAESAARERVKRGVEATPAEETDSEPTDAEQAQVVVVNLRAFWMTEEGACPVCSPLHNQPEEVWAARFPYGPPSPHPNCQCWLRYERL